MTEVLVPGAFWIAMLFSLFAGMTHSVGALLAVLPRVTNHRLIGIAMGFSAGALLLIAMVEAVPSSFTELSHDHGTGAGLLLVGGAMLLGVVGLLLISKLVLMVGVDTTDSSTWSGPETVDRAAVTRTGSVVALALVLYNFPEGFVTFATTLQNPSIGILVAIAVAISNIPEGMAIATPIYSATGDRWRAFRWGSLSGLAEPAGAFIGFALLRSVLTPTVTAIAIAGAAGIMVYISVMQLVPLARTYGSARLGMVSFVGGGAVALLGLVLVGG